MTRLGFLFLLLLTACEPEGEMEGSFQVGDRRIIGYWHSWRSQNVDFFPLREVPPFVNQVNIAFAYPDTALTERLVFEHAGESDAEIKQDIRSLHRRGINVLISVGGGNHPIELDSETERDQFVRSLIRLIDQYGFQGVDINLEGVSAVLDAGDTDFRNPTTPKIRYFIEAMIEVDDHFGQSLILSVAPETQYVVGGYAKYGEAFGGYLPILMGLRDRLDVVHMQLYNSGSQFVYTGDPASEPSVVVEKGTTDFIVALTEMMILGFPVANDPDAYFPGFPAEKVVVGVPSTPADMGSGTLTPGQLEDALVHLLTGVAPADAAYALRSPSGHPRLNGVMTWSLNWDRKPGGGRDAYEVVRTAGEVFRRLESTPAP